MHRALTAFTIVTLLFLLVAGMQAVKISEAYSLEPNPPPEMTPTKILIDSPTNNSIICENSISLVFNVSAPDIVENSSQRLTNIHYQGDWQTEKHYLLRFNSTLDEPLQFLEYNVTLSNVPEGTHTLQIWAHVIVSFTRAMFGYTVQSETKASIIFTIDPNQLTPNPTLTANPTPPPPTQQPTLESTSTASLTPPVHSRGSEGFNDVIILLTVGLLALAVMVSVAVVFKKKQNKVNFFHTFC